MSALLPKLRELSDDNLELMVKTYSAILNGSKIKKDDGMCFFAQSMLRTLMQEQLFRRNKVNGVKMKGLPLHDRNMTIPRFHGLTTVEAMSVRAEDLHLFAPKQQKLPITEKQWRAGNLASELILLQNESNPQLQKLIMRRIIAEHPQIIDAMQREKK